MPPTIPFRQELTALLHHHNREQGANTPDWILASYLLSCLAAFDRSVARRDQWYGIAPRPGNADAQVIEHRV